MQNKTILALIFLIGFANATTTLWDNGYDVRNISDNNSVVAVADLTVQFWDNETDGNLIWEGNYSNAIVNGSWNVEMAGLPLYYGNPYWKAYKVNEDAISFGNKSRLRFFSSIGDLNISAVDLTNYALKNQSEDWGVNNVSASNFFGYLNYSWITNPPSLPSFISLINSLDTYIQVQSGATTNISFNETKLNATALAVCSIYNDTAQFANYYNKSATEALGNLTNYYNKTASDAKYAIPGNCGEGQYVMNTTTSGVQCLDLPASKGANYTAYTGTGANTWTKPGSGTWVHVEMWGAGGSGGRGGLADAGGGGGGGGYTEFTLPITNFASSETCTVGTGGASCSSDECHGSAGGTTSMTVNGATYYVYGGGGGYGATAGDGGGGGGGGIWGAGQIGLVAAGGIGGIGCGLAGVGVPAGTFGEICGAGGGTTNGGSASWGGGGGGYGQDSGVAYSGGNSVYGGGGGAGGDGAGAPEGVAGTSVYGGSGGLGSTATDPAGAGIQPAGGGGGSEQGASGAGGNGKCVITVY